MVAAVVEVQTRTNIPVQVVNDIESPLINTSQVELLVSTTEVAETEVELETVGTETLLEGDFCTITGTTTEAETNCILCVSSKTKCYDCNQS